MPGKRNKINKHLVLGQEEMQSDAPPDTRQVPFDTSSCHSSTTRLVGKHIQIISSVTLADLKEKQKSTTIDDEMRLIILTKTIVLHNPLIQRGKMNNSYPAWESVEQLDALELRPDAKNRFYGRSASSPDYSGLTYNQKY
ncbi:unnamed protein product [Schistosoma margrebowiei]|uniref:Uncharacterized protein n=1 Tax=Schistosoma margrebowiei TaxID=48269 RepID=A0A183LAZ4_9TREM|nr:unnamed protein product [Schistosoma margrebowiei]